MNDHKDLSSDFGFESRLALNSKLPQIYELDQGMKLQKIVAKSKH